MEVKFLKAGTGDSILIHHKKNNILIDGGNDSSYLLAEIEKINQKKELIDLLIITHHDDDHIKGIIDVLERVTKGDFGKGNKFIKEVIFNSPRIIQGKIQEKESCLLSYKQAYLVEELLNKIEPIWRIRTLESDPILFDDLRIDILSPIKSDIEKYGFSNGAYLTSDFKCDWEVSMATLERYIQDKSQDRSLSNATSVVVQLKCEGKKILLTGDVTPNRLKSILEKQKIENAGKPVEYDYIKLPHHGSYRSLNKEILEMIQCYNFVISANSKKKFLPNKRALLKVIKHSNRKNERIQFLFNYDEALKALKITENEKKRYNISLTSNNENYGIRI